MKYWYGGSASAVYKHYIVLFFLLWVCISNRRPCYFSAVYIGHNTLGDARSRQPTLLAFQQIPCEIYGRGWLMAVKPSWIYITRKYHRAISLF